MFWDWLKTHYFRKLLSFLQYAFKVRMPCAECISGRCVKMHHSRRRRRSPRNTRPRPKWILHLFRARLGDKAKRLSMATTQNKTPTTNNAAGRARTTNPLSHRAQRISLRWDPLRSLLLLRLNHAEKQNGRSPQSYQDCIALDWSHYLDLWPLAVIKISSHARNAPLFVWTLFMGDFFRRFCFLLLGGLGSCFYILRAMRYTFLYI